MAREPPRLSILCREVSHQHNATRRASHQSQASPTDHLPRVDCSAPSPASPSLISRPTPERGTVRLHRRSGRGPRSRRLLTNRGVHICFPRRVVPIYPAPTVYRYSLSPTYFAVVSTHADGFSPRFHPRHDGCLPYLFHPENGDGALVRNNDEGLATLLPYRTSDDCCLSWIVLLRREQRHRRRSHRQVDEYFHHGGLCIRLRSQEILAIPSQMDILGRARLASRCPFYCFAKTSLAEGKLLLADGSGRPSRNGCGVLLDEPNVWTDSNPSVTGFSRVRSGASPIRSQTRGSTPR